MCVLKTKQIQNCVFCQFDLSSFRLCLFSLSALFLSLRTVTDAPPSVQFNRYNTLKDTVSDTNGERETEKEKR